MSDSGSTEINIGFLGKGAIGTMSNGKAVPLKTIYEDYTPHDHFPGNWYTFENLKNGVITEKFSGRIYICYGSGWQPLHLGYEPPPLSTGDPNYGIRYDKFEMTYDTKDPNSCADLTAIDYWAIPLSLKSMKNGTEVGKLTGVLSSNSDIYNALSKLSDPVQSTATAYELEEDDRRQGLNPPKLTPTSAVICVKEKFKRIVGPSSYPSFGNPDRKELMGLPFTPYNTFEPYLNHLLKHNGPNTKIATIAGTYEGNSSVNPQTPLSKKQEYSFDVKIDESMSLSLVGSSSAVHGQVELKIAKWDLLSPDGMYGGNPQFSIDGKLQTPQNDVYGWMLGDLFTGFNIGAIGSTVKVNGKVVGSMKSSEWFSDLKNTQMFSYLWPEQQHFYNQWAAALVDKSDAYGFAYAERFSAPLLNLKPEIVDTMVVEFLDENIHNK